MRRLLQRAARRSQKRERHAALVMKGGAIIALGYNHDDRHAEVSALMKLWPSKRRGTTVVSFRITPAGREGLAFPCEKCQAFLRKNGVAKVLYSRGDNIEFGTWKVRG